VNLLTRHFGPNGPSAGRSERTIAISISRSHTVVLLALLVACLAWFIAAPAAGAGTVQSDGAHLSFTANAGEANHLSVSSVTGGYRVVDLGATVTPGSGCDAISPNEVVCTVDSHFRRIAVVAGDLDDFVSVSSVEEASVSISGGDGADLLEAEDGIFSAVALSGGAGDDTLHAVVDSDVVLNGGPGADSMRGGIVTYAARVNAVSADTDGIADDGEAGEGDNVVSALAIRGGAGDDTLVGTEWLEGRGGNDTLIATAETQELEGDSGNDILIGGRFARDLFGGVGNDKLTGGRYEFGGEGDDVLDVPGAGELLGGPGNDKLTGGTYLFGGGGADVLRGEGGPDLLDGSWGKDVLVGGPGRDQLNGGRSDDTLRARDGLRDRVYGGPGVDRGRIDRGLDFVSGIETFF
jgi:Ca2+-binding RTX toxin-like protein